MSPDTVATPHEIDAFAMCPHRLGVIVVDAYKRVLSTPKVGRLALEAAPCVANAELSDADMAYVHIAGFVDSVRLALTSDA